MVVVASAAALAVLAKATSPRNEAAALTYRAGVARAVDPIPLGPTPRAVEQFCARRAALRYFVVLCPTRYPIDSKSRVEGSGTSLHTRTFYWASFNDWSGFPEGDGGHVVFGGLGSPFDLHGRPGQTWPMKGASALPAQLPLPRLITTPMGGGGTYVIERPSRILERVDIRGARGLILVAPNFPQGGLSGGHVIVVWNAHGHGYFISLHLAVDPTGRPYAAASRIKAAMTIAISSRTVD